MRLVEHTSFGAETPSRHVRKKMSGFTLTPSTIIVDGVPEYDAFARDIKRFLIGEHVELWLSIGYCRTHPNDDFNRKAGYKLAESRLKTVKAEVESVYVEKGSFRAVLKTADGTLCIKYRLGKRPVIDGQSMTSLNF